MSSFLTAKHLKVMLGQESRLEKAWADYYGLEILSRGMITLPFAIEQFYPHTQATEWELAVVRMIISCSSLQDGPVASFEAKEFAGRFHLSLRQIQRKFKAMKEKGLITITPCYDEKGRKTRSKLYDCNLFLDRIFTCLCADDDWQRQQSELLDALGIDDEDIDDLDMLSISDADALSSTCAEIAPTATDSERTSMSPAHDPLAATSMSPAHDPLAATSMSPAHDPLAATSMSPELDPLAATSMSSELDPRSGTWMSSELDPLAATSMSSELDPRSGTWMSSELDPLAATSMSSENPTSYVRAHTHALDSNSNSINTCINTLSSSSSSSSNSNSEICIKTLASNSSSNSNSKHDTFQFFDAEDDNTWTITTCADEQPDVEDVSISSANPAIDQAGKQDNDDARFEQWILSAIEQVNEADNQAMQATGKAGQAIEQSCQADKQVSQAVNQASRTVEQAVQPVGQVGQESKQSCQADERGAAASEQIQQQEQLQHQALEPARSKLATCPLSIVRDIPDEPAEAAISHEIEAADQVSADSAAAESPAPTDDPGMPVLLQGRSRAALYHISNDLHDAQPHSSRARARTLYNQLLGINQAEDEYTMSDPDLYFSDLMLTVKYHIRHKTFRSRDHSGQPNGMPLFFHELKKRVEDQVSTVEEMRKEGDYLRMYHERRKSAAAQDESAACTAADDTAAVASQFIQQQNAARETAQLSLTDAEIVEHAQRLQIPMSDEEAHAILDGTASDLLREQLTTGVRLGLYYEIIDA